MQSSKEPHLAREPCVPDPSIIEGCFINIDGCLSNIEGCFINIAGCFINREENTIDRNV